MRCANSDCESLVRSRIARIAEGWSSNRRDGFFSPRRIAPPSRTLSSSSSNILAFIAEFLLYCFGKLRHLLESQISRNILRIYVKQQDQVSSDRPVIH